MKIVILNDHHQLDLNHNFLYLSADDLHEDNIDDVINRVKAFKPDLFIEEEKNDGRSFFQKIYQEFPDTPKAWWCVDLHTNLIEHIAYAKRCEFTHIFCAQSWFIPLLENQVKAKVYWLPLCHTQSLSDYEAWLAKPKPERTIELSFVGNIRTIHVDRMEYVVELKKQLGDTFEARNQSYDLMLETLSKSKATFNCSLNDDLNFRVWEALATNTPLITDYVPDLEKISNLQRYIRRMYLRKTEKRRLKAVDQTPLSSTEFIRSSHTITHRIKQLLWMIESGSQYVY